MRFGFVLHSMNINIDTNESCDLMRFGFVLHFESKTVSLLKVVI